MPKTISDLPQVNDVSNSDLLIVEVNPNSVPNTKTIQVVNLFRVITSDTITANTLKIQTSTPANSTINVARGTVFFDTNYAYFAVANNVLKRVALSAF